MRLEAMLDGPQTPPDARGGGRGRARAHALRLSIPTDGALTARREFALPAALRGPAVDEARPDDAPASDAPQPPAYHPIKRNRYVSRARMYGTTPACQCDPATGDCGERCMNRLMQIVCTRRTCPCGVRCTNGSLGKRPAPELRVVDVRGRLTAVWCAWLWAPDAGARAAGHVPRRVLRRAD